MSLSDVLQDLEDQLEDLQRNAKFCLNNYDYHHKNDEYEILQSLQKILKGSYHDGREYHHVVAKVRQSINKAREICLEVDQKMNNLSISRTDEVKIVPTNTEGDKGNYASVGHSCSFKDESISDQSIDADHNDDDNKENFY